MALGGGVGRVRAILRPAQISLPSCPASNNFNPRFANHQGIYSLIISEAGGGAD